MASFPYFNAIILLLLSQSTQNGNNVTAFQLYSNPTQQQSSLSINKSKSMNPIHRHNHDRSSSALFFHPNAIQANALQKSSRVIADSHASPTSTRLSMIFERMSEECIGALVTAQNESARLGQSTVGTEIMTVGIIDKPENSRTTLKKYGITVRKTKRTVEDMFQPNGDDEDDEGTGGGGGMGELAGKMLNMNRKARDVELPFTPSLKRVLNLAAKIADKMNQSSGSMIRSEHVLLALFGWEEEVKDKANAKLDTDGYAKGALAVFLQIDGVSEDFSSTEFCRNLAIELRETSDDDELQLVSGGKKGKDSTPTLDECGVDLTKAAEDGELDDVFGRDDEIKACLRTLIRRRKNNPCLMGEPGKYDIFNQSWSYEWNPVSSYTSHIRTIYIDFDHATFNRCGKDCYCRGACTNYSSTKNVGKS